MLAKYIYPSLTHYFTWEGQHLSSALWYQFQALHVLCSEKTKFYFIIDIFDNLKFFIKKTLFSNVFTFTKIDYIRHLHHQDHLPSCYSWHLKIHYKKLVNYQIKATKNQIVKSKTVKLSFSSKMNFFIIEIKN